MSPHLSSLASYPMGPSLRQWMGIDDSFYQGHQTEQPSSTQREQFINHARDLILNAPLSDSKDLSEIVDELVSMAEPILALMIIDHHNHLWDEYDFRCCHTEGIAAMFCGELDRAKLSFQNAQRANPKEPAPYTNIAKILLNQAEEDKDEHSLTSAYQEAWQWLETALLYAPDHFPLWDQILLIAPTLGKNLFTLAEQHHSWVGFCCAFDQAQGQDEEKKIKTLETFFLQGERSEDFIIEWTAALGQSGQYEKVLQVILQAFPQGMSKIPWKIALHQLQAHLGLEHKEAFEKDAKEFLKNPSLPKEVQDHVQELISEL